MANWEKILKKLAKKNGWDASTLIEWVGEYYYETARQEPSDMATEHLEMMAEYTPDMLIAEATEIYEASMADEGG